MWLRKRSQEKLREERKEKRNRMHLLSTRPGGFVEDESIVTRLEQTPADIVILSSADTTLALLAQACAAIHAQQPDFPSVRLVNLLHLRQPA